MLVRASLSASCGCPARQSSRRIRASAVRRVRQLLRSGPCPPVATAGSGLPRAEMLHSKTFARGHPREQLPVTCRVAVSPCRRDAMQPVAKKPKELGKVSKNITRLWARCPRPDTEVENFQPKQRTSEIVFTWHGQCFDFVVHGEVVIRGSKIVIRTLFFSLAKPPKVKCETELANLPRRMN